MTHPGESAIEAQVKALRAAVAEMRYAIGYRGGMGREDRAEIIGMSERLAHIEDELARRARRTGARV